MAEEPTDPQPPEASSTPPARPRQEVAELVRTIQKDAATKARVEKERQFQREARKPRSRLWYAVLVLAALGNLYVWGTRPVWLMGDKSGIDTPEEQEGVLRFRMYVQGQRIESYRMQTGSIPDRLDQTGPPFDGMRYLRTGPDSWELYGRVGSVELLLRSSQSMDNFLRGYEETLGVDAG